MIRSCQRELETRVFGEQDMELGMGDCDLYHFEVDNFASSTSLSTNTSVKANLPRCPVVNFRRTGDSITMRPRAVTDTAGIAARVRVIDDTTFYLEEFSSRGFNFHSKAAPVQPITWSAKRFTPQSPDARSLPASPSSASSSSSPISSGAPSSPVSISPPRSRPARVVDTHVRGGTVTSRKASGIGTDSESSEGTSDSTGMRSTTISDTTRTECTSNPDSAPFMDNMRASDDEVTDGGYGVNGGVTMRPPRRLSLLCTKPGAVQDDCIDVCSRVYVKTERQTGKRQSLRRIFRFGRRRECIPDTSRLDEGNVTASNQGHVLEKVSQAPPPPSQMHMRFDQPIIFSDRRSSNAADSAICRQSHYAIPINHSAQFNCVKHGYLVDADVRSSTRIHH